MFLIFFVILIGFGEIVLGICQLFTHISIIDLIKDLLNIKATKNESKINCSVILFWVYK